VLPGVMGIEAFAEAAHSMFPDWHVEAVEDVNFLAPFKFYRNESRTLTIQAIFHPQNDAVIADCKLIGRRSLPNQPEPQVTTHFTARVRVAQAFLPVSFLPVSLPVSSLPVIEAADIYKIYFHGPAYQVVEKAWRDGDRMAGLFAHALPDNHQPPNRPTLMAPRLIELCFQTAGLWEMGTQNRMGLPRHVDRVSVCGVPDATDAAATEELYAVVTPSLDGESFDAEIVGAAGNRYVQVSGYSTVAVPGGVDGLPLEALHDAIAVPVHA